MSVKDELDAMISEHGMLLKMPIISSLSHGRTINRNVFTVVIKDSHDKWWIEGEFWATSLEDEGLFIASADAFVSKKGSINDIVFEFRSGLIPCDFYPDMEVRVIE